MAFNNAHYQTVADAIAEARRVVEISGKTQIKKDAALWALEVAARELASTLAAHHHGSYAFKRDKFLAAAGFPET